MGADYGSTIVDSDHNDRIFEVGSDGHLRRGLGAGFTIANPLDAISNYVNTSISNIKSSLTPKIDLGLNLPSLDTSALLASAGNLSNVIAQETGFNPLAQVASIFSTGQAPSQGAPMQTIVTQPAAPAAPLTTQVVSYVSDPKNRTIVIVAATALAALTLALLLRRREQNG